jgi:tetratricopeptide (TPR) repeat protein
LKRCPHCSSQLIDGLAAQRCANCQKSLHEEALVLGQQNASALGSRTKDEVFARSKIFDEISHKPPPASKLSLPAAVRSSEGLEAVAPQSVQKENSEFVSKDSGIFFVSQDSLILPVLELESSGDIPCIEDALQEGQNAIFASKLDSLTGSASSSDSLPRISPSKGEVFASKLDNFVATAPALPKPLRNSGSDVDSAPAILTSNPSLTAISQQGLHPEDFDSYAPSASSLSRSLHFARSRLIELCDNYVFGVELPLVGRAELLKTVRKHYDAVSREKTMRVLRFAKDAQQLCGKLCLNLLNELNDEHVQHMFYIDLHAHSEDRRSKIFERLIFSRLGLSPHAKEEEKRSFLLSIANTLFDSHTRSWAMDVIFSAYRSSLNTVNSPFLDALNNDPALYLHYVKLLFEYLVKRDTTRAPVIIFLQDLHTRWHGREDLQELFERLSQSRILLVSLGSSIKVASAQNIEIVTGPLNETQSVKVAEEFFSDLRPKSSAFVQRISRCFGGDETVLARITRHLVLVDAIHIDNFRWRLKEPDASERIPCDTVELNAFLYANYSEEQKSILTAASLIGPSFCVKTLARIMSLDPLTDEIPWFHKLREKWLQQHLKPLIDAEILYYHKMSSDTSQQLSFSSPQERAYFASQASEQVKRSFSGALARILDSQVPDDDAIVQLYENARMAPSAAAALLKRAKVLAAAFYNASLHSCLSYGLAHFGPEIGKSYVDLLLQKAIFEAQSARWGDAEQSYSAALRSAELFELNDLAIPAFIGVGASMRMQGKYNKALDTLMFAMNFAEHIENNAQVADCNDEVARILLAQGSKASLVNALRYADKALTIRRELGVIEESAKTLDIIAEICLIRGDLERAKQAVTEAYHSKNAKFAWQETPQSLALLALISCEESIKNYDTSMDLLRDALKIVERSGNVVYLFRCLVAMTEICTKARDFDTAKICLSQIKGIISQIPLAPWRACYFYRKAYYDYERASYSKTTRALKTLFEIAKPLNSQLMLCDAYQLSAFLNFEVLSRKLGSVSVERAERLFTSSIALYEAIGAWPRVATTQRKYAKFLKYLGREDEAEFILTRAERIDPR